MPAPAKCSVSSSSSSSLFIVFNITDFIVSSSFAIIQVVVSLINIIGVHIGEAEDFAATLGIHDS